MKIAVMGDLHYPSRHGVTKRLEEHVIESRDSFYSNYLKSFFKQEADIYVSVGDLTNFGTKDEFEEVYEYIRSYNKPFYQTLGNHDLYSMPRREVLELTKMNGNFVMEEEVVLLFLETARELDRGNFDGWVTNEQLEWLEKVIDGSGEKTMIVFAHHPVYDTTARSNKNMLSVHPSIDLWSVLNKKKGKGIYVNGHTHTDSIVEKENWTFVQISAVLDDQSVRILELDHDQVSVSAIDVSDDESIELATTIGNGIERFTLFPQGVCTTLNRNKSIKIR
ncbi:metallophosphoesterase [Brevibacillus ruminantium]|uniref:Metallophosphoesterase n=1 Tax=Brevibacillus ruminantium TaxID=2950604 RepID=A0ABY4WGB8_9BACL|nr:metallophosphoesterase [Brevibacillus ruminantium]USG65072.1 metallophosphoesterase [Brevibacillus ruminantium]